MGCGTSSELEEVDVHLRDSFPARSLHREERVCKLDFLPHLDSRDELCLPSRRVVLITLAQLWLGLGCVSLFCKSQKADVTFIFLNERKEDF